MPVCHACNKTIDVGRESGRRDECPFCRADLHCCLNCRFFDRAAPKQCREPVAEQVREKAKANFCDFFAFAGSSDAAGGASADSARAALDQLFKK